MTDFTLAYTIAIVYITVALISGLYICWGIVRINKRHAKMMATAREEHWQRIMAIQEEKEAWNQKYIEYLEGLVNDKTNT